MRIIIFLTLAIFLTDAQAYYRCAGVPDHVGVAPKTWGQRNTAPLNLTSDFFFIKFNNSQCRDHSQTGNPQVPIVWVILENVDEATARKELIQSIAITSFSTKQPLFLQGNFLGDQSGAANIDVVFIRLD